MHCTSGDLSSKRGRTSRFVKFHSPAIILGIVLLCGCGDASPDRPAGEAPGAHHGTGASPLEFIPAEGETVAFPSAGVEVVQPEGFEVQESFDGFGVPESRTSVVVIRLPAPFAEATAGFTTEQVAARGMTLRSRQELTIAGQPAVLLNLTQPAAGETFEKWILALDSRGETVLVTAAFPSERAAEFSDRLRATVLSTRPTDAEEAPPGSDVGFTIEVSPRMKLTRSISRMLSYTKDGEMPVKTAADPLFVAAPSLGDVQTVDRSQFALTRLRQTALTTIGGIRSHEPVSIDGLAGYETMADGTDQDSGTPLHVYQVMLFRDSGYILMQGLVGTSQGDVYLPEFKAMAHSMRQR